MSSIDQVQDWVSWAFGLPFLVKVLLSILIVVVCFLALAFLWIAPAAGKQQGPGASEVERLETTIVSLVEATPITIPYRDRFHGTEADQRWNSEYTQFSIQPNPNGVTLHPAEWDLDVETTNQRIIAFDSANPEYLQFQVPLHRDARALSVVETAKATRTTRPSVIYRALWYRIGRSDLGTSAWCLDADVVHLTPHNVSSGYDDYVTLRTEIRLEELRVGAVSATGGDELHLLFARLSSSIASPSTIDADSAGDWYLRRLQIEQWRTV